MLEKRRSNSGVERDWERLKLDAHRIARLVLTTTSDELILQRGFSLYTFAGTTKPGRIPSSTLSAIVSDSAGNIDHVDNSFWMYLSTRLEFENFGHGMA